MKIGIGIDTGGTYTDAVVYDFQNRKILGSAKARTTREDLTVGILEAMDGLQAELLAQAELVALSTTLATNACVEDKCGRAKLIFLGGDQKVIREQGPNYGLPGIEEILIQESYTKFSGVIEREPDWELFEKRIREEFRNLDGVGIIEMNAMRNGAVVEKKAKERFQEKYDIPVVCGHELFSELNCLQRGSSTLLNAALFPVIQEFMEAMKRALQARNMQATLVVVRSDGSLMSEEFVQKRPVETLLSGPAASTAGGVRLAEITEGVSGAGSIIVDMGGTTTDIALVRDGIPVTVTGGITVGRWRTFVDGLYVKTVGLGGDSAVHYTDKGVRLEEYRIVPLCVAAKAHPSMLESLRKLAADKRKHTRFLYEHYLLTKEITDRERYSEKELAFCDALQNGPLCIEAAAEAIGMDIYNLHVEKLLHEGVVQICGLTPTDIMHIRGDFDTYEAEASRLGAEFAAFNLHLSVPAFCEQVYDEIRRKLYIVIVKALLENKNKCYQKNGISESVMEFIQDSYEAAKTGKTDPLLSMLIHTDYTLVGLGAPIRIFLEDVAEMLGTRAVIPSHYEVANALGAVIGNVSASSEVQIHPVTDEDEESGYKVFGNQEIRCFKELEDAESYAAADAREAARNEAIRRGAKGEIAVTCTIDREDAVLQAGTAYLGTRVIAHAVGSVGIG